MDANYYINGDRHRMKQVFLNILDNAAKYGGDGKQIDIDLKRDGGNIVASVRDYGQGIPEAELPFVKEKFYKGSSKQRGSGIGLAVTEEIVSCTAVRWISRPRSARERRSPSRCRPRRRRRRSALPVPFRQASVTPFNEGEHMTTQKKTTIGGQAIIEGIVMKGPKKSCTVVRKANGELVSKTEPAQQSAAFWDLPILRGAYTLFTAMKDGIAGHQLFGVVL